MTQCEDKGIGEAVAFPHRLGAHSLWTSSHHSSFKNQNTHDYVKVESSMAATSLSCQDWLSDAFQPSFAPQHKSYKIWFLPGIHFLVFLELRVYVLQTTILYIETHVHLKLLFYILGYVVEIFILCLNFKKI